MMVIFRPEVNKHVYILSVLLLHVPVAAPQTYEQTRAVYEDKVYTTGCIPTVFFSFWNWLFKEKNQIVNKYFIANTIF